MAAPLLLLFSLSSFGSLGINIDYLGTAVGRQLQPARRPTSRLLLAKRFTLNPVLVIVSLVFWFWM